ncbi:hypothetical protein [Robiginitalea sp. IMCC43444]|uniref:hypothetical protein n=1 Tax=Robiginitalea sp. IMCC43444 TaxID=3459121 RepID=UPI0040420CA3
MIHWLSKLISYAFHPLLIPFYGTFLYFEITPKYSPEGMKTGSLLPIFILSVVIPSISLLILRNLGMLRTYKLLSSEERVYPLLINLALLLLIFSRIIPNHYSPEIYYFFMGLVLANTAALLMAIFKKVISLHMVGIGSLLMFLINLSLHFEKNIIVAVSLCTLVSGLIASSRLYSNIHGRASLLTGWLLGVISQLILIQFWI